MNVAVFCEASHFPVMQGVKAYVVTLGAASSTETWTAIISARGMQIRKADRTTEPKVIKEVPPPRIVEPDLVACFYAGALVQFADATRLPRRIHTEFPPPSCSTKPRCIVMRCIAYSEGAGHAIFGSERCVMVHNSATVTVYVCGQHFVEFAFKPDAARIVYRHGARTQTASFVYPDGLTCSSTGAWSAPAAVRSVENAIRAELSIFPVFAGGTTCRAYTVQCPEPSPSKPAG